MIDEDVPTVLLTGFESFAGASSNPSWDAVDAVAATWNGPARVVTQRLPVVFDTAGTVLTSAIAAHRPDLVIATGLAEGRHAISPERVAINIDDARIPDNAGAQPLDRAIAGDGPAAVFSGLPIKRIARRIQEAGVAAAVSNTAGTFVCNHVFFELMLAARRDGFRAGFIHVPATPDITDDGGPTMELSAITSGLTIAIEACLEAQRDDAIVGGSIH